MKDLQSIVEVLIKKMDKENQVEIINESRFDDVLIQVENDVEDYRFENQQKIKDSLEEISTVVLTA
jgi:hypothetical protein